jgi:hypothetical protein
LSRKPRLYRFSVDDFFLRGLEGSWLLDHASEEHQD